MLEYGSCLLHFLSLTSMYAPSLISIPFVLFKIWHDMHLLWKNGYGEITMSIYMIGLSFCALSFPSLLSIYKPSFDHFDLFGTFKDMAWTGIHYEKWLRGDNSINTKGRIMVLVHSPFSHCHLTTNQVSLKFPFVLSKIWPNQSYGEISG